jgi:hypothetical protein
MVVGDELEITALRKDCSFVVDRAIFETEEQTGGNPITTDDLEEVAHRKDVALFRTQREKTVDGSFHVAHGYGLRLYSGLQGIEQRHGN